MGLADKVKAGAKRAATEVGKALDKGKGKSTELQLERRMDGAAKKLGYLVFDAHRGRPIDDEARQQLLDDLGDLEEQREKVRAETAAKVAARTEKAPQRLKRWSEHAGRVDGRVTLMAQGKYELLLRRALEQTTEGPWEERDLTAAKERLTQEFCSLFDPDCDERAVRDWLNALGPEDEADLIYRLNTGHQSSENAGPGEG